ncbi:P-loop NTPase [Rhodophyticola sp.]|uniref:P-loop NTPase n=1 Tax=Rhodophyticola sp. TaxID=2680032 RepID=UPI003D299A7B
MPRMIAISSGKGGVGKSTVTANIAVAMADAGLRVGVVDADIYGPSIPRMLGIAAGKPAMSPDQKVIPAEAYGVKVMSMAMLSDDDSPAILRGPMVTKYLQMFVRQVEWGALDVLLLDLPPGTGDIQLTLAQAFPLTGAVVVSTPQDVSLKSCAAAACA